MNIEDSLQEFAMPQDLLNSQDKINQLRDLSQRYLSDADALKRMFNSIDLTTLSHLDSAQNVRRFVERVNQFSVDFPSLPNVGGICVYSVFAPILKSTLKVPSVHRAVVAACFPSSQAFADIKAAEVRKSVESGATEVDVVISVGEMIEGNYQFVFEELSKIRQACDGARLKVILESGALKDPRLIWDASIIAMEVGADFIKTSTGKNCDGASPEAALVMCSAIAAFAQKRNRKVGFKPAGGVSTPADAALYFTIVKQVAGDEWVSTNTLFRIGASRLANSLLSQISAVSGTPDPGKYF